MWRTTSHGGGRRGIGLAVGVLSCAVLLPIVLSACASVPSRAAPACADLPDTVLAQLADGARVERITTADLWAAARRRGITGEALAAAQARELLGVQLDRRALRLAVALIQHVTPDTTGKINAVLGYTPGAVWRDELNWGARLNGAKVAPALVLFPRPAPPAKP